MNCNALPVNIEMTWVFVIFIVSFTSHDSVYLS